MRAPDVNILVYAHQADMPQHERARRWLVEAVNGPEPLALFLPVVQGFLRVVTNPRAFSRPVLLDQALGFADELLASPATLVLLATDRHWIVYRELVDGLGIRGADLSDAVIVALALEHGCELVTSDAGFARFPGLRWSNPLRG